MYKLVNPKQFILSGKAEFGLYSVVSDKHINYVALLGKDQKTVFIYSNGQCLGAIKNEEYLMKKVLQHPEEGLIPGVIPLSSTLLAAKAFNWYWERVLKDTWQLEEEKFYAYHHGRCGYCRKELSDPESIRLGIGPTCRKKLGLVS